MWTKLSVVVTAPGGAPPIKHAGHTRSILKKQEGKWFLAREANVLAPAAGRVRLAEPAGSESAGCSDRVS
jgi:hypothetical protein